jgi:hypothetical protein
MAAAMEGSAQVAVAAAMGNKAAGGARFNK